MLDKPTVKANLFKLSALLVTLFLSSSQAQAASLYLPGKTFSARLREAESLQCLLGRSSTAVVNRFGPGYKFGRAERIYYLIGKRSRNDAYLWLQVDLDHAIVKYIHLTTNPD